MTSGSSSFSSLEKYADISNESDPYVISSVKLIAMCIATLGLFEIYWFYRQWKSINSENKLNHGSFALSVYALFAPLSSFSLFKHVSENAKKLNNKGLNSGLWATLYFALARFWLGFLPLIPVQKDINHYWEQKYGNRLVRSGFGLWNWVILIVAGLCLMSIFNTEEASNSVNNPVVQATPSSTIIKSALDERGTQEEIVSSVVNIFCPSIEDDSPTGGSGTILDSEGIILTNSHIIPQNKTDLLTGEEGCLVVLPDPVTGQPSEMFLAKPLVIPGLSDDYDLAYMQIYAAYYDEETGEQKGTYPRTFPAFDVDARCENDAPTLGEPIRIFGYPAISGGYSLTITEGVVSSFPGDGLIVTSAKISHGNSGGLAVDKNGCMIGVPSLVSSDESESLGVIYSMDILNEFSSEVIKHFGE